MGREKEHRQRIRYQVQSAKTAERHIVEELESHFGASGAEAEMVAERCVSYLESLPGLRLPDQIVMGLSQGRAHFHRGRRPYVRKPVVLTPVEAEDLELELEFGLKALQNNRLLRFRLDHAFLRL